VKLPGNLGAALANWMAVHGQGSLRQTTAALVQHYRRGKTSSRVDLGAYVATRVPATFAANRAVHAALADVLPVFAPRSLLDVGTGPGVASWAALSAWPTLTTVVQCEQDDAFADLVNTLNVASDVPALVSAILHKTSEAALPLTVQADLVVASYMLAELPLDAVEEAVNRLWARAQQVLVLIEPGTPQGFERLRRVRMTSTRYVIAPCTHHQSCPIGSADWCHFKTRLSRSREHMHAKQARVPFEDEAYSYLILSRQTAPLHGARIIGPPRVNKTGASFSLCTHFGLEQENIVPKDRAAYKRAKKAAWGDRWE
jgi:ribosomal protein RSM22 (predicted rRNA methylase)